MTKAWETYEQVAQHILNEVGSKLGLASVEPKQAVAGKSGATWMLDAKGVRQTDGAIIVVEARRHTTKRLSQEQVAAVAYRISDIGAGGGIIVAPFPLQSGAEKVAAAGQIVHVELNVDATPAEFRMKFLDQLVVGLHTNIKVQESVTMTLCGPDGTVRETRVHDDA